RFTTAHIILLLVSPRFMDSQTCYGFEMMRVLERHKRGEAIIIPIVLSPVDWKGAPFGKLQALPLSGKPITRWQERDEALMQVAKELRKIIEKLLSKQQPFISENDTDNYGNGDEVEQSKDILTQSQQGILEGPDNESKYL